MILYAAALVSALRNYKRIKASNEKEKSSTKNKYDMHDISVIIPTYNRPHDISVTLSR